MSWLPIYNSWAVFVVIVSVFLWKLLGVVFFLFVLGVSLFFLVGEVLSSGRRYPSAFWLFILTEMLAFGSLFSVCIWSEDEGVLSISDYMELPLLGSFLLLSSSVTVTAYHHFVGLGRAWVFLVPTVVLGLCFVLMQIWELADCECDLLWSTYDAACFCTVGLHFSHVLLGVGGLSVLLYLGARFVGKFYVNVAVWYWHFVDYVWLWVFLLIYVA
uniref:Cytochrome c oxidase subunit 3 n=1 Tax=Brachycladium goliath TaxID=1751714 RepID=A0A140B0Z3_9TREM|nr:cytochrome c oxidase subunit III [Brachycladium goliath]ALN38355.1 cytochrome c oxidase subunit III [Brachycladium goliath]